VTIDSGTLEPTHSLHDVPPEAWGRFLALRRDFLATNLNHDCRQLVRFIRDAERMWAALGYADLNDLIRRGLELEPEEVGLAVRWLELNDPQEAIGMPAVVVAATAVERGVTAANATKGEVLGRGRQAAAAAADVNGQIAHLDSQADRAQQAGVSQRTQRKLDALARRAPALLAEVRAGRLSAHRACVEAGIVTEPTPLERLRRLWVKATPAERARFRRWIDSAEAADGNQK
jgi:hypothetical protein